MSLTRRSFIVSASAFALAGCQTTGKKTAATLTPPLESDPARMYAAMPDEQFPLPAINPRKIDPKYYRQLVDYSTNEPIGTIVVDTPQRFLYLTMENGQALRYGVGIGRAGFAWGGRANIAWKRKWPTWTPPKEMIKRQPELKKYAEGMEPGLKNPLGARALYIFENGKDTLYRLHGTSEVASIGRAVSSGCVRLLNQDICDLYDRVPANTRIVVHQEGDSLFS
ncbi:L,D-transpeptidase [Breoghania sp.]|uniref:L,D-transpeptidase n=1 Tax=Breoghania sp. TaxID=2065378 RepID=UPI0029C9C3E7|nr:L,D-transpeptidase [Breoghania sp.]